MRGRIAALVALPCALLPPTATAVSADEAIQEMRSTQGKPVTTGTESPLVNATVGHREGSGTETPPVVPRGSDGTALPAGSSAPAPK